MKRKTRSVGEILTKDGRWWRGEVKEGTNWSVELFSFDFSLLNRRSWRKSDRHGRKHAEGERTRLMACSGS